MSDTFGRNDLDLPVTAVRYSHQNIPSGYLRISITDRCNMKCSYCHNEGQVGITRHHMRIEDLRYIVTNALRYGLNKVRLTGGEPLLHPECHAMLRMLKHQLAIPTVGFNTNGMLLRPLLAIVADKLIDDLVIGLDYVDQKISKDSIIGFSSERILSHILQLQTLGQNISIACVYDGNYDHFERLAGWCLEHDIVLKILEISDQRISDTVNPDFMAMARRIIERFELKVGIIATFSEYYGHHAGRPRIYFFHSHCNVRECGVCGRIHIRVTADGHIKSCIQEDTQFPLLTGHFDESMLKVIANLGQPPELRRPQASQEHPLPTQAAQAHTMRPVARDKRTSMEEWCTRVLEAGGKAAALARALLAEEEEKLVRLEALASSIGLPLHENHCFTLPDQSAELLDMCRALSRDGWKLSLRILDRAGRLLFRDVDSKPVSLPVQLRLHAQNGAYRARLSPYKEPDASGTVMISAGDTRLEMVYGPHYWLTKAPPEGVSILRCRYEFPFISLKYSTEDPLQRRALFRHLKNIVRMTLGINIRQLPELNSSLYAEYHWRSDQGYKFLECSFSPVWTGRHCDGAQL